ncbi:MAG: LON peptidase substrate-binding domain-containing protein [Chloroflexi bacterium]|nr:LON peptidase substrate-binding domain-containing protein [Chloroflexota bacterium]MCI0577416.1 LON peptidase substrate-binding domain-containing protein [Chloroflexota bacterium]MCI0649598.1 LON peptidase substrate-binding domain-containing protein [Chloroflexota bacterium]MCI0725366.1 LON peptidase substrate-binding domain-containing protein [Chloroflexota bacterium]
MTFELPLFPLHTVLFPGMPLALHIFEERYKLMIGQCIEERQPFGVVLVKQGLEALGPLAKPHPVGCTAQITQVQPLEEGQMNIGAVGRERFRILSLDYSQPYLIGQVEAFALAAAEPRAMVEASRRLRPWVQQYMELLSQLEGVELDPEQVPREPVTLAYLAAMLLQVPAEQKQELLAIEQATRLMSETRTLYRREVALVKAMFAQPPEEDDHVFSLN